MVKKGIYLRVETVHGLDAQNRYFYNYILFQLLFINYIQLPRYYIVQKCKSNHKKFYHKSN